MLIASLSERPIDWVAAKLMKQYDMKDLGEAQKYIGLYILRDVKAGEMWVHIAPYILDLREKFGIRGDSFPDTPLPSDFVLFHPWEEEGEASPSNFKGKVEPLLDAGQSKRFQQIVGSLNYVAHSVSLRHSLLGR